jgi:8-oxo-dGTP diphosphatase
MNQYPRVGVAIILTRGDRVLLMKRKGPHGTGTWSTPGGHLEFGETPEQCAAREASEEVGVDVVDIRFRAVTNDLFEATGRHYITIWMEGRTEFGEPRIAAEREVAEFGWYAWDSLPEPLFLPLENLVKANSYPPK